LSHTLGSSFPIAAIALLLLADLASAQVTPITLTGAVTDASGSVIVGALVTLTNAAATAKRTTVTDPAGAFHFASVEPGSYMVTVAADGFAPWTSPHVAVSAGENTAPLSAVLQVAPTSSRVDVGLPPKELAVQQVKAEEQQRLLGVFPHYFVTYEANPAPLDAAQKFQLGWKTIVDPVTILGSAIGAGIQQARNSYHEFGQGTEGYVKRFGAQYADNVNGVIIGQVLTQVVFRQDPRYFYKGKGTFRSRVLYAFATAFVCKGDNGHWQPDYSDVIGGLAAGEISTLYYPASSRTGLRLFHNVLLGFAGRAAGGLFEEFLARSITSHVPKTPLTRQTPVLREGTPLSLISVEDLSSKTAGSAGPITFVLTSDLQVGGATVAGAGAKASGQVTFEGAHVGLEGVHIKVGDADIPLRSTQVRGGTGPFEYHQADDSGRIALVLYVARNVPLR